MPRYVILRHELPEHHGLGPKRESHWDLMLQCGGVLRTWAMEEAPADGVTCRAEALADHRLAYLEYEGPVSGNRGVVSRFDAGQYEVLQEDSHSLDLALSGGRSPARVVLTRNVGDGTHFWSVSFSALPTRG